MKRIAVVLVVILDVGFASAGAFVAQSPPASSPPPGPVALPEQTVTSELTAILDVRDFCCPEYLAELRKSVEENWQATPNTGGGTAMIRFDIKRNGQIAKAKIEVSSRFAEADERALRAVRLAKLAPLPSGFRPRTLTVHLRFSFLSTRRAASTGTPGAEAPPGNTPAVTTLGEFLRGRQLELDASPGRATDSNAPIDPGATVQFDSQGVDFGPWIRGFIAQVKRNWLIPSAAMKLKGRTVVTFSVSRAGVIRNVKVAQPSGVEQFDRAAFNAVLNANPLEPLPPAYPRDEVQFTVSFSYNEQPPTK